MVKKILFASTTFLLVYLSTTIAQAQTSSYSPTTTAVPSLRIAPDARAASLGEQGVATSADVYAQHWSSAKYAFMPSASGIALSYTPWLRKISDDISLLQAVGYYRIDKGQRHTLGASLSYFSIGDLREWNALGETTAEVHPYELSVDVSYNYRISRTLALGGALRFIHADYGSDRSDAPSSLALDLSAFFQKPLPILNQESELRLGASLRNIGSKMSFDSGRTYAFLPTTLSLGAGIDYHLDAENKLDLSLQIDKLLVPVYPNSDMYPSSADLQRARRVYWQRSSLSSMLHSFSDGTNGLSDELKEIRWGLGLEYRYKDLVALRAGYSYLHPEKGNLQALTVGAGLHWRAITLDLSYLISTASQNPQDGTLRCSLALDLANISTLFGAK